MVIERDVQVADGRTLRAFDSEGDGPVVFWHHGTPHTGAILAPLLDGAVQRGLRLVTYARPGYRGSTLVPGRDVASAAGDAAAVASAFGVERFAVMGASGGGPHALACAALLPDRVSAAATFAGLSQYTGDASWFADMADDRALRAALEGRDARLRHAERAEFDPAVFTDADWATLNGAWGALGEDAGRAAAVGPDGQVDDDMAFVSPWGFDPADIAVPVLIIHGDGDRMVPPANADRLMAALPKATRWERPGDGHVSVMAAYGDALDWLVAH
ncbi:alpha/beta hydrolase [Dactylosporangium vinaceum]|uniref:Alpha/beta fold hydrolase n=1 Tax=Dactylosporangium vinaceum TaxID=53362 RepID=A0ABV5M7A8_9ACTN|nr:alpha/beta hydrolase [Dactylosporangium vinaceum]UAB95327.1 alpha/beta hydrolase [Dactylosporangium vinaceum]